MNSIIPREMYTTCESIWRPSLTLTLLWLQICQKKCASTAEEDHPQDSPQQAAHRQSVKETRVRSSTYYKTYKQITIIHKTKDDHRREKEELHLEGEDECKSMEYLQEKERKARE